MNFLKRALWSVKARKGKTLVIFLLFMVICNLVLAGFAIQSATGKASELARQKLGGEVTLQPDMEKLMQQAQAGGGGKMMRPRLSEEDAKKLAGLSHVRAYNYIASGFGLAEGFEVVKSSEEQNPNANIRIAGSTKTPELMITGVLYGDLMNDFNDQTSQLVEGRHITEEDEGENVAVIEKNLANQNNLKLGDKLKIASINEEATQIELEIVGIYETTAMDDTGAGLDFMNPYNHIYTSYQTAMGLRPIGAEGIDQAIYFMDDPVNIDAFKSEAEKTDIDFDTFVLDANDSAYKQMMTPIENVASFSNTVVYIVAIAGGVILSLLVLLAIKERRYEMGVLLSIGEKRGKLIGQFLAEILFIAVFAFAISILTGNTIAQQLGNSLLEKETALSEEQTALQPAMGMKMRMGPLMQKENNIDVDPIEQLDVSIGQKEMMNLGLVGLLITIFATIIPSISVLRLHPKTILTRNE